MMHLWSLLHGSLQECRSIVMIFDKKRMWSYEGIIKGLILMLWGFFIKVVLAERLGVVVDAIFSDFENQGSTMLFIGGIFFLIQLYCDFAGYSTIAIGAAKVMGFSLMENFTAPLFSSTVKEFWSNWHISLSTWFRDYLYIPLGGSRCSKWRNYFNLMVTFLVSGLWHGAAAKFVLWGGGL